MNHGGFQHGHTAEIDLHTDGARPVDEAGPRTQNFVVIRAQYSQIAVELLKPTDVRSRGVVRAGAPMATSLSDPSRL